MLVWIICIHDLLGLQGNKADVGGGYFSHLLLMLCLLSSYITRVFLGVLLSKDGLKLLLDNEVFGELRLHYCLL